MFKNIMNNSHNYEMKGNLNKVKNEELFNWFHVRGKWILKKYFSGAAKLKYEINKDGIMVKIVVKEIIVIPELDKVLLDLLKLTTFCSINKYNRDKFQIILWFRGWVWRENE